MTGHTRLEARGQGAEAFAGCRWERRCLNGCVHGRQKQQRLVTGGHRAGAPIGRAPGGPTEHFARVTRLEQDTASVPRAGGKPLLQEDGGALNELESPKNIFPNKQMAAGRDYVQLGEGNKSC